MTLVDTRFSLRATRPLPISVKAHVRGANVMPELKPPAYEGTQRLMLRNPWTSRKRHGSCLFRWRLIFAQRTLCRSQNRQLMRGLRV